MSSRQLFIRGSALPSVGPREPKCAQNNIRRPVNDVGRPGCSRSELPLGPKSSWQYLCASSKAQDPHRYYRLHHLASVQMGLDGAGLWVWGDDGGQFNDYDGPHTSYGMVYATDHGPITGKRREAWREGVEDVKLFRHLRTLAEKTGDARLKALHHDGLKQAVQPAGGSNNGAQQELMSLRLKIRKTLAQAAK